MQGVLDDAAASMPEAMYLRGFNLLKEMHHEPQLYTLVYSLQEFVFKTFRGVLAYGDEGREGEHSDSTVYNEVYCNVVKT